MFHWLKQRFVSWIERLQQQDIERLHRETLRLKAEWMELNDGKPIVLTEEQRRLLREKAKRIDPETLKWIAVLDIEDSSLASPGTSADYA